MQIIQGMPVNLKLKNKEQWFCDLCGGVIESDKDGMLEWNSYWKDEVGSEADEFRIVHGRWIEGCKSNRSDDNLSDGHLHWFTGPDGLNKLLEMYERYKFEPVEFNKIIRRIHVDYYEEGSRLVPLAREDGDISIDPYDRGDITQSELLWLIRKYGRNL
ncbi:hypothetical protein [Bacillus sp. FSL K6-6540]|uniref:hypothetical protein n=1 Tax=Bacillus sp. FSL K6-6540 TaxID=2921512 RepID=UPI0030F94C86